MIESHGVHHMNIIFLKPLKIGLLLNSCTFFICVHFYHRYRLFIRVKVPPSPFCVLFPQEVGFFSSCRVKVSEVLRAMFHHLASLKDFYLIISLKEKRQAFFLKLFLEAPEIRATTRRGLEGLYSRCLYFLLLKSILNLFIFYFDIVSQSF